MATKRTRKESRNEKGQTAPQVCVEHQADCEALLEHLAGLLAAKKPDEAIQATVELLAPGTQTTGRAPTLYDLSEQLGSFDRYRELCAERDDLLGYVISLGK